MFGFFVYAMMYPKYSLIHNLLGCTDGSTVVRSNIGSNVRSGVNLDVLVQVKS